MTEGFDRRSFDRERQLQRARVLVELLDVADKAGLPPMNWTVWSATGSALYGGVDSNLDPDPQGTFEAWVRRLGLRVSTSGDSAAGYVLGVAVGIQLGDQKAVGR